jgi:myo-inositol-1(or 4)-monophosphatase
VDLRTLAEDAAQAGARELLRHAGHVDQVRTKTTSRDLVTAADVAAGIAVCRAIAESVEGARFIVEEPEVYARAGVARGTIDDSGVWVVDPLDGTTSFVHGYPCWGVSVAFLESGEPVAGAVLNVPAREMTSAAAGSGATTNGLPLACSNAPSLDQALLVTGFPYDRGEPLARQLRVLASVLEVIHDVRRDGSAAVDCCHVAAGRADGFWEFGLHAWDLAAGVLVLREAGALVTDPAGRPWTPHTADVVAANPQLHEELRLRVAAAAGL